ncbi:MAG: dethiobiotin synthase [Burkholderiales bacterium]|nr:dethiobiotin synthase [Burkholderiales bacterium]
MTPRADLFVTGTDTGVGKTLVAAALVAALAASGRRVVGMKPVAAGLVARGDAWVSEDAETLMQAASVRAPRALVNPFALRAAVAPAIAARSEGVRIALAPIARAFAELRATSDAVVVEGAGGFRVPLCDDRDAAVDGADLAQTLRLPVVLVVGMRLGCVNHALLSAEAIAARGLALAGWVANRIDPAMACFEENVATLKSRLEVPLLGTIPHLGRLHARSSFPRKPESRPSPLEGTPDADDMISNASAHPGHDAVARLLDLTTLLEVVTRA